MIGLDVGNELADLLKVYSDAEAHLKKKEERALEALTSYMKTYTEAQDERKKVSRKLEVLIAKLKQMDPDQQSRCDCGCEDEDEEDDE